MSKFIDITGKRYNNLFVIEFDKELNKWKCRCDCGNITYVSKSNLMYGGVKSCGCLRHKPRFTHNLSHTKIYQIWNGMKNRCYNRNLSDYKNYGARGIYVCDEWKNSFETFYEWAIKTGYKEGLTIERIDNNDIYKPDNCKWITKGEQVNNRRNCCLYTYQGKTQNLAQWCKELELDYALMHDRIRMKKWDFEKAIKTPVDISKRNKKSRRNFINGRVHKKRRSGSTAECTCSFKHYNRMS